MAAAAPSRHRALKTARRTLAVKPRRRIGLHPGKAGVVLGANGLQLVAPSTHTLGKAKQDGPATAASDDGPRHVCALGIDTVEAEVGHHLHAIGAPDASDGVVQLIFIGRVADDVVDLAEGCHHLQAVAQI